MLQKKKTYARLKRECVELEVQIAPFSIQFTKIANLTISCVVRVRGEHSRFFCVFLQRFRN